MMVEVCFYLFCGWVGTLILILILKYPLFKATWNEPYFDSVLVVIESDDWGPGDDDHIHGLHKLLSVLKRYKDTSGRTAVLTANIILTIPDSEKMVQDNYERYEYKTLPDHFGKILGFMRDMYDQGLFFPQLHGLAHYYPEKITEQAGSDSSGVRDWICNAPYEWENLPHQLQAHYIDGAALPSEPVAYETQKYFIETAVLLFKKAFGFNSRSTVAPCYLWDDTTEKIWTDSGFRYIQTAGYRCTGLDSNGNYVQDPKIIRAGDTNFSGLIYLVRTVMFEPRDFCDAEKTCIKGIKQAVNQGLPVVISTHRYNYAGAGSCLMPSIEALDRILTFIVKNYTDSLFLNSEELSVLLEKKNNNDFFLFKLRMFLCRLWYRHKKLRYFSLVSLLILPGLGIILGSGLLKKNRSILR